MINFNNIFDSNSENNIIENEDDDINLNISNLEIDIEHMNDETDEDHNSKIENPIRNIHQNFKSFIQFNNNLSFKLAAEKSKNTPSYMLALCPKLYMGFNKKKIIKENYAVNDAISEEMDSDTLTPKNSKNRNSIEEKNTKYSTKEKYSDRNKKPNEFESEDCSYEIEKKNTSNNFNNSNSERKNKNNQSNNSNSIYNIYQNVNPQKKQKAINNNNNFENIINNIENNAEENNKTIANKKRDKKKKKLNLKDINIETQNINNINNINNLSLNNDIKNSPLKINCFLTSPNRSNVSFHHSNNTINNIIYNETENNNYNYNKIRTKILKIKNNEYKEKHQKAKSLISNINLSTLHLYETIQNNTTSNNNVLSNKKQKLLKNNIKSTDYRNKILNKEKKVIENDSNGVNNSIVKRKSKDKHIFNNNNRTNSLKNDDEKNNNFNNGCNNNVTNKKKLKKIAFSHLLKSPKYKVNPFLSNFTNNNDKSNYNTNNDTLYTLHNTEYKYSNYYELFKKRNNNCKINNTNNNTINTINSNNELTNNFNSEINNISHCKKISQQFIDEYNLLLETKNDDNKKNKILNNNNEIVNTNVNINKKNSLNKYFSYNKKQKINDNKETPDINNKSVKFKIQINKGNNSIKKISQITPCHKKSRTFFISPSYVIKNINNINEKSNNLKENKKTKDNKNINSTNHPKINFVTSKLKSHPKKKIISYNTNKKILKNKYSSKNNNNTDKDMKNNNEKDKNKFSEIKQIIGETLLTKIIHKKTNTIGSTNILSNLLNNNFFNYNKKNNNNNLYSNINNSNSTRNNSSTVTSKQLKKAASINNLINNLGNKKKIVNAMQRIKFIPVSNYPKAIKELFKSKNNNFVILVYKDENQRFVFRGLYETFEKDPKIANKLFAPNSGQNNVNINNINYFYNYSFDRGDFIRYKFIDEKKKKFNEDTIIIF